MLTLTLILLLAAVPDQSLGQEEKEVLEEETEVVEKEVVKDTEEEEEDENEEDEEDVGTVSPEIQKLIVDKHNEIRRTVLPPAANMLKMVWNDSIAQNSQKWAEKCIKANSPEESRELYGMTCGETVYQSNHITEWSDALNFWQNGKRFFKYGVGATDPNQNILGYTQLIWYNSHMIGCAAAFCPDTEFPFMYICQYCSGGNLMSQLATPYKEGKWCEDCPNDCENKLCTNPCQYTDVILNCKDLKKIFSCSKKMLVQGCQATCKCDKMIV